MQSPTRMGWIGLAALSMTACGASEDQRPAAPKPESEPELRAEREVEEASGDLLLVVNKGAASVSFVDPDAEAVIGEVEVGEGPHEVAASPDGELAVVTNYGTQHAEGASLSVIDVRAREVVRTIELGEHRRPHGVAWLPDGSEVLVTAEGSRHLLCVDPRAGEITCEIPTEQEISHMVAITPDGARAFVANIGSGTATAIDLSERAKLDDIATGAGAEGVAVSPDGAEVWVTNRAADTVSIVDVTTLEVEAELSSSQFPIRAHITADGAHVLVTNARSGTLAVFDRQARALRADVDMGIEPAEPDDERVLGHFENTTLPIGVVTDARGERAYIAHALSDLVSILDMATLETIGTIEVGTEPDGMAYVPEP